MFFTCWMNQFVDNLFSKKVVHINIFCVIAIKINQLQKTTTIHNFHAKYAKILDMCKRFPKNLVNEHGNVPRRGVVPEFPH